jgi:transglutaminase-like putative cysteine protease
LQVLRFAVLTIAFAGVACPGIYGQGVTPAWHLIYAPNHRATYEQQWTYTFPNHHSTRWIIALRYPPELAWSRQANGKAELLTSAGWKPFTEVRDGSHEERRMLTIDYPHNDPKLQHGFTIRTTLTATIYDQHLKKGKPARPVAPLTARERESYLQATNTFDFHKPSVKKWMDEHKMWKGNNEQPLDFVHRVYKELRLHVPYSTGDGGPWICSQILKVGFGECCRHAIVGTSILRANNIAARTVCGPWAIDAKSQGGHCWGEFFLEGVGWVLYDTTLDSQNQSSEAYFGNKTGQVLAGMVDFDWVIHAGPFGKQTVFAIDAFPAYWSQGRGNLDSPKVDTSSHVRVVKKFR